VRGACFGTPLEEQLAMVSDCQRSAPFLAQIGRLLIAQGRYADALDHLERAIMFDPDMASAQLDYAIALAGSGDMLSARQLLDNIIAQPDNHR
jgi:Flp pilus assembly protein TadD